MPRLKSYVNDTFPNPGPMAELASATEKRAYYVGQTIEQGWNALGRGISKAQNDMERKDEAGKALAEQEDIANLTVAYAVQNAKTAVEWKKTAAEGDPSDSTMATTFMEGQAQFYDKIHSMAKTDKGRLYSTKARAEAWASNFLSTSADVMNLNSEAATAAVDELGNSYSTAAFYDPGNWKAHLSQMDLALDAQIDANGLNAKDALKLRTDAHGMVARSALKGMIDTNPQAAQQAIASGEFAEVLNGEELAALDKSAEERISSLESDKVAKLTKEEKARKTEASKVLNEIQGGIVVNQNGTMTIPADYFDNLNKWKNDYGDVISPEDYRAAKQLGAAELRRVETEDLKTSDPSAYKKLTEKLIDGTLTERDANLARAAGQLSTKDYTFFKGAVPNEEKGENKELKDFTRWLGGQKGYIAMSAGAYKDSAGESRYTDYQSDMLEVMPKMLAAGKSMEQIQEYARKALPSYTFTSKDIRKWTKENRKAGAPGMVPDIKAPADTPNQSLEEFYKSSGVTVPDAGAKSLAKVAYGETRTEYIPTSTDEAAVATTPASRAKSPYDNAIVLANQNEQQNEQTIEAYLKAGGFDININGSGSTPWCAAFVNASLAKSGIVGTGKLTARSFLVYGDAVNPNKAQKGDIVVLERGSDPTQGHVGFFDHYDEQGNIVILSGNAGSKGSVNLQPYKASKLLGIRRPPKNQQIAST